MSTRLAVWKCAVCANDPSSVKSDSEIVELLLAIQRDKTKNQAANTQVFITINMQLNNKQKTLFEITKKLSVVEKKSAELRTKSVYFDLNMLY